MQCKDGQNPPFYRGEVASLIHHPSVSDNLLAKLNLRLVEIKYLIDEFFVLKITVVNLV